MKKSIIRILIPALALNLGIGLAFAADKAETDHLSARAHQVNAAAKSPGMMDSALHDISVSTGVPLDQVQALHKRHSNEGVAGVLIACAMADETGKSPEKFMETRATGKTWTAIARDNNVRMEKLNDKIDHLEKVLTSQEKRR